MAEWLKKIPYRRVNTLMYPFSSQVGFTVFMNIAGGIFAITAIVLYAIDLANASLLWMCDGSRTSERYYDDKCRKVALLVQVRILQIKIKSNQNLQNEFNFLCTRNCWRPWTPRWLSWRSSSSLSIFGLLFWESQLWSVRWDMKRYDPGGQCTHVVGTLVPLCILNCYLFLLYPFYMKSFLCEQDDKVVEDQQPQLKEVLRTNSAAQFR